MEMTSLERINAVLNGEMPDRVPVVPQSFMFSAKHAGYDIGKINRNPKLMAKSHMVCQEKFGYDGCVIDVDDATLAEACGAKVLWRDDNVACVDEHHPLLSDLREIDDLELPNPLKSGRICEWLETTSILRQEIGDHVWIMGRADQGPFSLLSLLRGTQEFMMDLLDEEPEVIKHALEWTTKAHTIFAKAQIEAGAHATSMGDAYASPNLVSADMYKDYALPYEIDVVNSVQTKAAPYSIHICGDTTKIISQMGTTGAKILEVDWRLDMKMAREIIPDSTILMGNVNPSFPLYLGKPEDVSKAAKNIIDSTGGKGLILSSGCAIGPNTNPDNIQALVDAARLYGTFDK